MKLFVWNNPYQVSYGGTCLYVLAHDITEALQVAQTAIMAEYGDTWDANRKLDGIKLGEPSRVIDRPYAECYKWAE